MSRYGKLLQIMGGQEDSGGSCPGGGSEGAGAQAVRSTIFGDPAKQVGVPP